MHTEDCCDHVSGVDRRLEAERHCSKSVKEHKAFAASIGQLMPRKILHCKWVLAVMVHHQMMPFIALKCTSKIPDLTF